MNKMAQTVNPETEGDLVLREVWRAKEALSAARGHSIDRLFADLRKREKQSGHPVVNLCGKIVTPKKEPRNESCD